MLKRSDISSRLSIDSRVMMRITEFKYACHTGDRRQGFDKGLRFPLGDGLPVLSDVAS